MAYIGIVSATDSEQLSPNYIGFQPTTQHPQSAFVVDTFTGNGVQTVFPLSNPKPVTSRALLVSVAGELKVPVTDYDLDNTGNIDFTSAPLAGDYITVHHLIFPKNEATTSVRKLDDISGDFDGVTTRFTLTANGVAANILGQNVLVISIDGVIQEPGVAYTMSGDDIIFSEAPTIVSSFYAVDIGTTGIGTPSDATVSPEKFLTDNNPATGKVLAVNSSGGLTWAVVSGSIGATDLDGLADVSVSAPLAGQVLRYNGTNFVNTKINYSDIQGPPNLATVATSGNYNDLTNKPVYPTDISGFTDSTGLLFNGDYGSLTNLPSIPDKITELTDTDILTPSNGDVLVWNGLKWINDNLTLSDLGIVDGTAGQVLTTDGAGGFTFTTVTGGGGGGGATGPQGPAGADGNTWYSGNIDPTSGIGVDGDFYLNATSYDVFKKASGTWSLQLNIKGATGATGPKGDKGDTGATGPQGLAGPAATLYLLEAYANVTYTLPGSFTEDICRYSIVSSNVNVSSSWFDTSTYTFTPQKAGYWQITASYDVYRNAEASMVIKKNTSIVASAGSFNSVAQQITKIVYLNGSTDYINIYSYGGAALSRSQYAERSWFQARWIGE